MSMFKECKWSHRSGYNFWEREREGGETESKNRKTELSIGPGKWERMGIQISWIILTLKSWLKEKESQLSSVLEDWWE
jgi:hypothetical protein